MPLAVGAAISPTLTAVVLALLAGDGLGRKRAFAFWIGAALSMVVWVVIVSSFMWQIVENATRDIEQYSRVIDIVLGVLLITVGLIRISQRGKPKEPKKFNLKSLGQGPFKRQALFGAFMQGRNATSVLLFCAAQQRIDASQIPWWQRTVLSIVIIIVTTASIWIVLLIPAKQTAKFGADTAPLRKWLGRYGKKIEVVAALGFGLYLIIRSTLGLLAST